MVVEIGPAGALPLRLSSLAPDGGRGLRLACVSKLTQSRQDNVTEITAWGLAPETVAALREHGTLCRVLAGWRGLAGRGQPSQIASGRVLTGTVLGPRKSGGDWLTQWSITDGGLDVRDVIVSESWRGDTSSTDVLDRLIAVSGLARGSITLGREVRWAGGYVVATTLRRALAALARVTNSVIVVQDGALQAWPVGGVRRTSGQILSPDTGMVDDPEQQDGGVWTVRSLLLPGARPGDGVTVRSRQVSGSMRVIDVTHDVDTEGAACDTVLTLRPA